jgi:hypothetical protein
MLDAHALDQVEPPSIKAGLAREPAKVRLADHEHAFRHQRRRALLHIIQNCLELLLFVK